MYLDIFENRVCFTVLAFFWHINSIFGHKNAGSWKIFLVKNNRTTDSQSIIFVKDNRWNPSTTISYACPKLCKFFYHRKTPGVGTILDQITANFLTFHHASLFPRLVIDLFIWLPLNYGTIFPFLLEIYLQLMLSRRLLKLIYFRRRFPANLLFLFSLLRRICI